MGESVKKGRLCLHPLTRGRQADRLVDYLQPLSLIDCVAREKSYLVFYFSPLTDRLGPVKKQTYRLGSVKMKTDETNPPSELNTHKWAITVQLLK